MAIDERGKDVHTETTNIIAPRSLESSLHAFVMTGSPNGTNANPGGGFGSVVSCKKC